MATAGYTASGLPSAFLEPFGSTLGSYTLSELQQPVDISNIAPKVAGIDPFIQIAQQRAAQSAGLGEIQRGDTGNITGFTGGTGISSYEPYLQQIQDQGILEPGGYQQYMSPYQQSVIDQATQALQRQAQISSNQRAAQATQAGAFGGARFGVQEGEAEAGLGRNIADITSQLQAQNYAQAVQRQQQQLGNLTGLASFVPQLEQAQTQQLGALGAGNQGYQQSILDAQTQANQLQNTYGLGRLGTAANIFANIAGGVPAQPTAPLPQNPALTGIGAFANTFSLLSPRTSSSTGQQQSGIFG
jgi:hypothetical protein